MHAWSHLQENLPYFNGGVTFRAAKASKICLGETPSCLVQNVLVEISGRCPACNVEEQVATDRD